MKCLIWGYYGFGNLGDDLMLKVIVSRIRERYPDAEIHARCLHAPAGINVIPLPIDRPAASNRMVNAFCYAFRMAKAIFSVDLFILGGGTFFLDKGRHNYSLFFLALAVLLARLARTKAILIGTGIDILTHPVNLLYLRYVMNNSEYISLRDEYSYTVARYVSSRGVVVRSSDILFDPIFTGPLTNAPMDEKKHIVVTLSDYFAPRSGPQRRKAFIERSCDLIVSLRERYGDRYTVVLYAFQKDLGERDYEFMKMIRDRIIEKHPPYHDGIRLDYASDENHARKIFGSALFTIGMRYHGLVLSALFQRPFLGIDIEMKIKEFCGEFGMPSVNIHDFLQNGLSTTTLDRLLTHTVTAERIDKQAALTSGNFAWLNTLRTPGERP